jgi:hypothetical protein
MYRAWIRWVTGVALGPGSASLQRPSRTLLQADPQCSITELLDVQAAADPVATVTEMFATNSSCAMCLVPCGSAGDALSCAAGCLKQDEGACTQEEVAALEAVGMPSSLADRAQIVHMLDATARACVRCILDVSVWKGLRVGAASHHVRLRV